MLGRGVNSEISPYVMLNLTHELSANIIDLCPVGALISKPYSFLSRLWESESLKFIDIMDTVHSNIEIHT